MHAKSFFPILAFAVLAADPAAAVERTYSVTSFSRVRVEGAVTVEIISGGSPGARVEGDRQAIDRLRVETSDGQLMIGIDRTNWTGELTPKSSGRAILYVRAASIESLSVIGAGDVSVDRANSSRFSLIVTGAGRARIDRIDVDQITVGINGAGSATLSGRAKQARIRSQGEGQIAGAALAADDAEVTLIGAGEIRIKANRSARAILKGSGRILIEGAPACGGTSEGSGEVVCGSSPP